MEAFVLPNGPWHKRKVCAKEDGNKLDEIGANPGGAVPEHVKSIGWQLRLYLMARPLLQPVMRRIIAKRVSKGKEDPARSNEKFGISTRMRPEGRVIWVHAVGLGEVLALRPLIAEMHSQDPKAWFLLTSTARSAALVIQNNLPPQTIHQFLPLDGPLFVRRFLDHWRPDVAIWSEQDLWPGAICDAARRRIPLAYINARLSEDGFARRRRLRGGFAALMRLFDRVYAQDDVSQARLQQLGAENVQVMGSLKPASAPLSADPDALAQLRNAVRGRGVWVAASTHAGDEAIVLDAHKEVLRRDPTALLILVPRVPDRIAEITQQIEATGLSYSVRSATPLPTQEDVVFVADSFGELGLWYRLATGAFVGGSFADVGGHNPWEAIALGCPVVHGPNTQNFAQDYLETAALGLTTSIPFTDGAAQALAAALGDVAQSDRSESAAQVTRDARARLVPLATDLLALKGPHP